MFGRAEKGGGGIRTAHPYFIILEVSPPRDLIIGHLSYYGIIHI